MSKEKRAGTARKTQKPGRKTVGLLSFTEDHVLKGVACCKTGGYEGCVGCPYYTVPTSECIVTLMTHTELYIERLRRQLAIMKDLCKVRDAMISKLMKERERLLAKLQKGAKKDE